MTIEVRRLRPRRYPQQYFNTRSFNGVDGGLISCRNMFSGAAGWVQMANWHLKLHKLIQSQEKTNRSWTQKKSQSLWSHATHISWIFERSPKISEPVPKRRSTSQELTFSGRWPPTSHLAVFHKGQCKPGIVPQSCLPGAAVRIRGNARKVLICDI